MGNMSSLVNGLSFNNMSATDVDTNKDRLFFAYQEYLKLDPKFFETLDKYLE